MKKHYQIDCTNIKTQIQFYTLYEANILTIENFGKNLDALYDSLMSDIELPCVFKLIFLSEKQEEKYHKIIDVFKAAAIHQPEMHLKIKYKEE